MSAFTIEPQPLSIFSPESIRLAVSNIVSSLHLHGVVKNTNLVLDGSLSRSLTIAHHVFKDCGLERSYSPTDVLFMTNQAVTKLCNSEDANLFRDEVIKQFEAIRNHFQAIPNHGYTLAVLNMTHENNVYGLANWLAENGFSMSKTVRESFNVFNADDLKEWINTPINIYTAQSYTFLAILLDILCHYSYTELQQALKA